jgi:transposase-like protein
MTKKPNKRSKRYPVGFRLDAVERMKHCTDAAKLAEELGVSRGALYLWKRKAEGLPTYRDRAREGYQQPPDDERARTIRELQVKVASLEGELGRRTVEASFFESALRRVEGARRQNDKPGGMASTTKSAAGRVRKAR